jgi:hypothetical protein
MRLYLKICVWLVVANKGVKLNWATYALVAHEKHVALQVAKEKKGALLPILKQASVL